MSKRPAPEPRASLQKRPKLEPREEAELPVVTNSAQLRQLLTFQQDAIPELKRGIATFKSFLDTIRFTEDKSTTARSTSILKEFLQSQITTETCLPDILQTWNYAGQVNNDGLLSAVPSVLAVLLRTISSQIEFRELGSSLCKGLLQPPQLKLFSRCLSSPKHKEHVISPSLRLVTELVTFDGGAFSKKVYDARSLLLDTKILSRNLSLWRFDAEGIDHIRTKPSIRLNALRLTFALLKFLTSPLKGELLRNNQIPRAIFEHCKHDHPAILKETLDTIRLYVCQDGGVPRSVKGYVLGDKNLCSLATIFRQDQENMHTGGIPIAKAFLTYVCTNVTAGALRPSGWYPPGTEKSGAGTVGDASTALYTSLDTMPSSAEQFNSEIPVRNTLLSKFAQFLRPYANTVESELLVEIFQAAPELVADYFVKKSGFTFDPKLTSTWMGYAAFLFSVVRLPPPPYLGAYGETYSAVPPPVSIILENILPQPLPHKVLSRCLNQQYGLISMFVLRILIAALEKLRAVISHFKRATAEVGSVWDETLRFLVVSISNRCPTLREIVTILKKTPKERIMQSEAILRLLKLYLEIFPNAGFEEKLDMSQPLSDALYEISQTRAEDWNLISESTTKSTALLRLNHVLQIAKWTPEIKWWNRIEILNMSPFVALLNLLSSTQSYPLPDDLYLLFSSITISNQLVQSDTCPSSVDALIGSLKPDGNFSPSAELFGFLDDAFARLARKPVKYLDDFDALMDNSLQHGPSSLIWMTLVEQWPHALLRPKAENIAVWLGRFMAATKDVGEDATILGRVKERLTDMDSKLGKSISRSTKHFDAESSFTKINTSRNDTPTNGAFSNEESKDHKPLAWRPSNDLTSIPPPLTPDSALHQALSKTTEDAIVEGDLGALLLCLSSEYPEVARQAYLNITQVMHRLSPAMTGKAFADSRELYLLLGILTNTVKPLIPMKVTTSSEENFETVPYAVTVYAAAAAHILTQPLHPLYSSIARFHTKSPKWDIARLATYWLHKILGESPEVDDGNASLTSTPLDAWSDPFAAYPFVDGLEEIQRVHDRPRNRAHARTLTNNSTRSARIQFLLSYIMSSLRSEPDLQLMRRKNVFEPLLTLVSDSSLPRYLKSDVMRLVWRITCIEGGSTMLITRLAIISWLKTLLASSIVSVAANKKSNPAKDGNKGISEQDLLSSQAVEALGRRIWETCDQEHVTKWAGGGILDFKSTFTD